MYFTIGCHPTRSQEFDEHSAGPEGYKAALVAALKEHAATSSAASGKGKGKAVAIGECGLDYDRLHFSPKETQRKYFAAQLELAETFRLPLFLHSRAAAADLLEILRPWLDRLSTALAGNDYRPFPSLPDDVKEAHGSTTQPRRIGVVHSFTGTVEEAQELLDLGLFIGINGCSLKTEENLHVLKAIPLDRLLLETDAPWCDLRPTHAGTKLLQQKVPLRAEQSDLYTPPAVKKEKHDPNKLVKGRNEPCAIGAVAAVVAAVKGLGIKTVADAAESNTQWLFDI